MKLTAYYNPLIFSVKEYEDGSSPVAKIVHDIDKFDMIFQANEYETGLLYAQ